MKEIIRSMYIAWVPGHKEIEGNVLADKQAKEAASEMSTPVFPGAQICAF